MNFDAAILLVVSAIFINNFVFAKFLGICPFIGVSKKLDAAIGMGVAVTFTLVLASVATWASYEFLLVPLKLEYLYIIVFILIIAALVQLLEMVIKKAAPALYRALGIYLPLITTNCAVLGVAAINMQKKYTLVLGALYGLGAGLGFTLALVLMAGIRERLEEADIPRALRGTPIAFITAALMSLAFLGFAGMVKE